MRGNNNRQDRSNAKIVPKGEASLGNIKSFVGMRTGPKYLSQEFSSSPSRLPKLGINPATTGFFDSPPRTKRPEVGLFLPKLAHSRTLEDKAEKDLNYLMNKWMKPQKHTYWCCIGLGNTEAVTQVLKNRGCWSFSQNPSDPRVQFVWKQTISGVNFQHFSNQLPGQPKVFNHFEFHKEVSQKDLLLSNMHKYCQLHGLNVFDYLPPTLEIKTDPKSFAQSKEGIKLLFDVTRLSPPSKSGLDLLNAVESLKQSGTLKTPHSKMKLLELFKNHPMIATIPPTMHDGHGLWILKPTSCNRGTGIEVISDFSQLQTYLSTPPPSKPTTTTTTATPTSSQKLLLQKYIERPLLISGRKFDIRFWVLLDSLQHLFAFPEGYLRLSSSPFSCSDRDKYIHLTNNAVQLRAKDYGKNEAGNQLGFDRLEGCFEGVQGLKGVGFRRDVLSKMIGLARMAFGAAGGKINAGRREKLFELFGMDFMIDELGGVWLIEVNTNPCLALSSPLLGMLIPRMLDDAFKMVLDPVFPPPPTESITKHTYPVEGYKDDENMWFKIT